MGSKLPVLSGREVVRVFGTFGWQRARQSGSHIILTKSGEVATLPVPDHDDGARHAASADPRGP